MDKQTKPTTTPPEKKVTLTFTEEESAIIMTTTLIGYSDLDEEELKEDALIQTVSAIHRFVAGGPEPDVEELEFVGEE